VFRSLFLIAAAALALPVEAMSQRPDPAFEGPRGVVSFTMSDGEPISFFLEWSRVLDLTSEQKMRLIEIRRRLRKRNEPWTSKLDSLRDLAGVDLGERARLTARDREALARFDAWSKPVIDSIRVNNDAARAEARLLLDNLQRARSDSILALPRDRPRNAERRPRDGGSRQPTPGLGE
jgi:hypothetical protein